MLREGVEIFLFLSLPCTHVTHVTPIGIVDFRKKGLWGFSGKCLWKFLGISYEEIGSCKGILDDCGSGNYELGFTNFCSLKFDSRIRVRISLIHEFLFAEKVFTNFCSCFVG